MRSSQWKSQGNVAVGLIAALALVAFANYFAQKYYTEWDFTSAGFYSLSERSEGILDALDADVRIVSFLTNYGQSGSDALGEIDALLDRIAARNPARIGLTRIDPARDPMKSQQLLQEFDIDPRYADQLDVVVVESGTRRRHVRLDQMVQSDGGGSFGAPAAARSLTAEGALVGAIAAVTRERRPAIRFATGHGELPLDEPGQAGLAGLAESLRRSDMQVEKWESLGQSEVPPGTDLVVVAGPTQPWLEAERRALEAYLASGGSVWLLLDPVGRRGGGGALAETGLEPLLRDWGLSLDADVVLDPPRTPAFMSAETFAAQQVGSHPVAEKLAGEMVLVSMSRSLSVNHDLDGVDCQTLLESSPDSWGETTLGRTVAPALDGDDPPGPLTLAVACERRAARPGDPAAENDGAGGQPGTDEHAEASSSPEAGLPKAADGPAGEHREGDADDAAGSGGPRIDAGGKAEGNAAAGRLVVTGDADMASNMLIDSATNRAFGLNVVSWSLTEDSALGIPPKDRKLTQMILTPEQSVTLMFVSLAGLPLLAVISALLVWQRRRRA